MWEWEGLREKAVLGGRRGGEGVKWDGAGV